MKKALFATTALVAFTGAAAADVTLSGSAEMGIAGGDGMETQFFQDVDVKFTLSGESDSGLSFGAVVDLDEAGGLASNFDDNGTSVFLSGNFGTLTMGDTDGALDWALRDAGNVGNPGSIADDETSHIGYLGAYGDGYHDGQILRYDHSIGGFGFAISAEMDDTGTYDTGYAVGLKYTIDLGGTAINLGAGYQTTTSTGGSATLIGIPVPIGLELDIWGVSADASFGGGFSAGIEYSDWEYSDGTTAEHVGIGIGYTSGPVSVHANYGMFDTFGGPGTGKTTGYGLAAAYDLGGGLSANLGYGHSSPLSGLDTSTWSFGMVMSF